MGRRKSRMDKWLSIEWRIKVKKLIRNKITIFVLNLNSKKWLQAYLTELT